MIREIVSWYLYDFLMICVSYFIYMFNRCYIDEFIQHIQFLSIYLIVINCFFFLLLFLATMVPWKGSMKPVIYQIMHFLGIFLFKNSSVFNIVRLTFLASESLKLIQKIHHFYKKAFMNIFFPVLFTGSLWIPSFSWKVLTSAIFRAVFVNFHVWENFPQEGKFF